MPNRRRWKFERLAKKFEELARELKDAQEPKERREYLQQMRSVINDVDELILEEHPTLGVPSDSDARTD
jgi:sugar-specific transcriptional regulator TrmB